jgi:hypothetical protein
LNLEEAAIEQLNVEDRLVFALGRGRQLEVDLEQAIFATPGIHLNAKVDLGLRRTGAHGFGRARIFKGQVTNELRQDPDAGAIVGTVWLGLALRSGHGCASFSISHMLVPSWVKWFTV